VKSNSDDGSPGDEQLNPDIPGKFLNEMAKVKSNSQGKAKLSTVTPSGRKDQSFFELVYQVARQIPYGRVTSYGAIAACLGTKLSARMVGWAMNGAHEVGSDIPAHRVVNRVGMLTGKFHFGSPDRMQQLLEKEGIKIEEDKVVHFKTLFWDPAAELEK
jgi:methylated-DNA-protein-cysteine methyltransferase-like protein